MVLTNLEVAPQITEENTKKEIRLCIHCERKFVTKDTNYHYCSDECRSMSITQTGRFLDLLYMIDKEMWDKVHADITKRVEKGVIYKLLHVNPAQ